MRFEDSGLKDDMLVESAFNYAQSYTQSLGKEMLLGYKQLIDMDYQDELDMLEEDLEDGIITHEVYDQEKSILEIMRAEDMKEMIPSDLDGEINRLFRNNCVGPALEIQNYSEKSSPALIAAALLSSCVRDPIDCKKIEEAFGSNIAALVAEKLHVEAYPARREENITAISPDAKRIFMAHLANDFREAAGAAKKHRPGEKAFLPSDLVNGAFTDASLLWGNDKKLDGRVVSIFNQAAQTLSSAFRIEVDEKNALELVRTTQKIPTKKKPGKKPGHFGDDGF